MQSKLMLPDECQRESVFPKGAATTLSSDAIFPTINHKVKKTKNIFFFFAPQTSFFPLITLQTGATKECFITAALLG